jgi:hypothetical protein
VFSLSAAGTGGKAEAKIELAEHAFQEDEHNTDGTAPFW